MHAVGVDVEALEANLGPNDMQLSPKDDGPEMDIALADLPEMIAKWNRDEPSQTMAQRVTAEPDEKRRKSLAILNTASGAKR
jgi:hypothetical protein